MQTIPIKHGVGTKHERLLKLEERMANEPLRRGQRGGVPGIL